MSRITTDAEKTKAAPARGISPGDPSDKDQNQPVQAGFDVSSPAAARYVLLWIRYFSTSYSAPRRVPVSSHLCSQ